MKSVGFALRLAMALAVLGLVASPVLAKARITSKTRYYSVSGTTGYELFKSMNRRGPRHAFMQKAMAQTQYKTSPRGKMVWRKGVCRVENGGYDAVITYVFPRPAARLSPAMKQRWATFMKHTTGHERVHGRIAVQMANALDSRIRRFAMEDSRGCRRVVLSLRVSCVQQPSWGSLAYASGFL